MKKTDKKGAGDHQWVFISFFLAIVGFIIILLFWFRADLLGQTDEQLCHASVVSRGTAGIVSQTAVPLNCKTEYACLSKDGSCEQMPSNKKIIKVRDADEVYEALAERMQTCWWMFGEGKINYVGKEFEKSLYCSICSQVGLDDSLDFFPNNSIDKKELYKYLATKGAGVPEGMKEKSILEYLIGIDKSSTIEQALLQNNSDFGTMTIGKPQYIVMGIFSQERTVAKWVLASAGIGIGLAITIVSGGSGAIVLPLIVGGIVGGGGGYLLGTAVTGESGNEFLTPTIIEANSEDFAKLDCGSINTLA